MLLPLRGLSGRLRRSLSTGASRLPWALIYRISTADESARAVSLSLAAPPLASRVSIPKKAFGLDPIPATSSTGRDFSNAFGTGIPPPLLAHATAPGQASGPYSSADSKFVNVFGSGVLAASSDGFLLLSTFKNRARAWSMFVHQVPNAAPFEVLDHVYARSSCDPMSVSRFVCNPITGQLFRLPDIDGAENTYTAATGLLTEADGGHGPPRKYAAAQLSVVDGGHQFLLRRFSSDTGEWEELVLPSPLPPERRMYMNHEVLDFGGRLWWVDVSWGAVCVDPFSDRPELCPVEFPGGIKLPDQQGETEMGQLVKHRRMGVSDGRLRFVEVSKEQPFRIKSFTLDDESGCWKLEHQLSFSTLISDEGRRLKEAPLIGALDPLSTDLLYLTAPDVGKGFCFSIDMRWKRPITSSALGGGVHPSKCESSFLLPCVLPSFLGSSTIPGDCSDTSLIRA